MVVPSSLHLLLLLTLLFHLSTPLSTTVKEKKKKEHCKRTKFNRTTTNYQAWREQMTVCDLLQDYDSAVRPSGRTPHVDSRGPVIVTTSIRIRAISAVSEKNMEFVAQFKFKQEWYDERLRFKEERSNSLFTSNARKFDFITVAHDQTLWIPDTFFQNEKNGWYHMLDQENRYLKIRSDGRIEYDRRLTLHLSCPMNLLTYPMDVQTCLIDFASYAYTTADIEYVWRDKDPIHMDPEANGALPNFDITTWQPANCTSVTGTGSYSCLRVKLKLVRVFSFFLLQLYIPSSMLVGVAWVSYWIDWKSTAARVPLAIVTLLTMITTSHAINSNLPPVSYAKSIDIWVGACVVFIFFSLIEYAVVNYVGIMDEHREMRKAACNRSRLNEVIDSEFYMQNVSQAIHSPNSLNGYSPVEKKRLLRRRGKKGFELREDEGGMEMMEALIGATDTGPPRAATQPPDEWTLETQDPSELLFMGQRRRVELVRWCSVLSSRGRAERIDILARIIFPIAFIMFNIAYWSVYLEKKAVKEAQEDF